MQFFGSENEQLCIILQMEHNTAFVDMMSSLGKDNSTTGHNGRFDPTGELCQLSVTFCDLELLIKL